MIHSMDYQRIEKLQLILSSIKASLLSKGNGHLDEIGHISAKLSHPATSTEEKSQLLGRLKQIAGQNLPAAKAPRKNKQPSMQAANENPSNWQKVPANPAPIATPKEISYSKLSPEQQAQFKAQLNPVKPVSPKHPAISPLPKLPEPKKSQVDVSTKNPKNLAPAPTWLEHMNITTEEWNGYTGPEKREVEKLYNHLSTWGDPRANKLKITR